ncbi:MAG: caspase family protein [Patescibacteria group bacterium]|nr:caspase family protein [Patescibacteria group bacterium]
MVRNVLVGERRLVIEAAQDGGVEELDFRPGDRFFVNDRELTLRELAPGDEVEVSEFRDPAGRRIKEVRATRPVGHVGIVAEVKPEEAAFTLMVTEGDEKDEKLLIHVPPELPIAFNGMPQRDGQPVVLADLQVDDRISARHKGVTASRVATELSVTRVVETEGILREVNADRKELVVASGPAESPKLVRLPLADKVDVTLNGRRDLDQKLLRPADLKPGDKVTVAHDTRVVRVDGYRILGTGGTIEQVHVEAGTMDVATGAAGRATSFRIGPRCSITLAGQPAELADLRRGDEVDITHDDPGAASPEPIAVVARRPPDASRWALLVANQEFDDLRLSPLKHPVADAQLLRDTLTHRYKAPATQTLLLGDESLVRLEQGIPDFLRRLGPTDQLLVYVAGHAYQDDQGTVFLAPKNFDFLRMDVTGLRLQWLVDQLEACPAGEKLLLLDATQAGDGADLKRQPSAAEMIGTLKAPPGRAPLRTVTVVAGTSAGERGQTLADGTRGLYAALLAESYAGEADKNRDTRIEPTELFTYLSEAMPREAAKLSATQTPHLALPDDRPPRLTDEAKKGIRRLAGHLRATRPDGEAIDADFAAASELAGKELEPRLLYGMLLLKARDREKTMPHFEELRLEDPELLLPLEAMAWMQFDMRRYPAGVVQLAELVGRIPTPQKETDAYDAHTLGLFTWVGRLREFSASAGSDTWQVPAATLDQVDAAVALHGYDARQAFEQGRAAVKKVVADFDNRIANADSDATASRLRIDRRQLVHYAAFPFEAEVARILVGLDRE